MNRRTITDRQEAWLRKAWASTDIGVREIYAYLGIGGGTLQRLRDELQLGPKAGVIGPEDWEKAQELSAEGLSPREIAKRLGTTKNTIYQRLRRRGAVGGVLLKPEPRPITPEYEAMLRRVAAWDTAAASGLARLERQRGAGR